MELRWKESQNPNRFKEAEATHFDRLAPVYPILQEEERTRVDALPGIVKAVPEFDLESGRWLYWTKENNLHIFHHLSIETRNSLDDLEVLQRSKEPKPHPARPRTLLPPAQK